MAEIDDLFRRLKRLVLAAGLPGAEAATHYGQPALKVGGKAFVSVKDAATIVLSLPIEEKERLIEMAPEIYFQTDHYRGWPSLPLHVDAIGDDELTVRLAAAWRFRTPKKIAAAYSG